MSLIPRLIVLMLMGLAYASPLPAVDTKDPTQSDQFKPNLQLADDEQDWLEKHKTVRIAYDGSLPPYSFINEAGDIDGIAVEIIGLLGKRLGIEFVVYPDYNWATLYRAAAKRKVDMVATMVSRSDRADWFRFTKPYLTKSLVIVTKQDNTTINSRGDIADKKIAVAKGYQYGEQVSNEFPDSKQVKVTTMLDCLKKVDSSEVDAAIIFLGTANYLQARHQLNNLRIAAFYDRNSANESIAIRKDWPMLVGILQKGLDSLTEQEVQKVFAKWVVGGGIPTTVAKPPSAPVKKPVVPVKTAPAPIDLPKKTDKASPEFIQISKLLGVFLFVAGLFFVWFFLMKKQKRLHVKGRNEMMNSSRNLQSKHNEEMHMTIIPEAISATVAEVKAEVKSAFATKRAKMAAHKEKPLVENIEALPDTETHKYEPKHPGPQDYKGHLEQSASEYIYYQHDTNGQFSYVSASVNNLLGYTEAQFMQNYRSFLTDNPNNKKLDAYIEACVQGHPNEPYQIEIRDARGGIHWFEVMDSPVYNGQGHCTGVDGVMHKVARQTPLKPLAEHSGTGADTVSGGDYAASIQAVIDTAARNKKPAALLNIELGRMRSLDGKVLDATNPDVLIEAGKRLNATLRDSDATIPLATDKFTVLLPETNLEAVVLVIEKIKNILQVPYLVGVQLIVLDANIGWAVYPDDGDDVASLLEKANVAASDTGIQTTSPEVADSSSNTKIAKAAASKPAGVAAEAAASVVASPKVLADTKPNDDQEHSLRLQQDLVAVLDECKVALRASKPQIRSSELTVYYQSRHNLENYHIVGFEALIRWQHPQFGLLLPKDFVPLVKDIGMLDIMTYWIIQQVGLQAVAWEELGVRQGLMDVNLGDLTIKQSVDVKKMVSTVKATGASADWLSFSIPAKELEKKPDAITPIISALVDAGHMVSIDNFSADSAFLENLEDIPAQIIELDPSFTRNNKDADHVEVLKETVERLHTMGMVVIGKEVEIEEDLKLFTGSGCDMIQGHLLSRPLPPGEAKKLMETLPDFAWYFQQD